MLPFGNNINISSKIIHKSSLLNNIRQSLMCDIDYIIAKPYKLIVSEKNCFCKTHKDSQCSPLHFGSLILLLPCFKTFQSAKFVLEKEIEQYENQEIYLEIE